MWANPMQAGGKAGENAGAALFETKG